MERVFATIAGFLVLTMTVTCCNNDDDDDGNGPGKGPVGPLAISGVSGSMFWGEELTIEGTGFSPAREQNVVTMSDIGVVTCNLNLTSAGGDIEILTASPTELKIRIPYREIDEYGSACGPERIKLEVEVNGARASLAEVRFAGLPFVGNFRYHYGWFGHPTLSRIGDSVLISGGINGYYARESAYWNQVQLSIDGISVPIKYRTIGLESGWAGYLPASVFASYSCGTQLEGWTAREVAVTFSIEGTGKSATRMLYLQKLPERGASCTTCGEGLWTVEGSYVRYYPKVFFTPINCDEAEQHIDAFPINDHKVQFEIPLAILTPTCSYMVQMGDLCGARAIIGYL